MIFSKCPRILSHTAILSLPAEKARKVTPVSAEILSITSLPVIRPLYTSYARKQWGFWCIRKNLESLPIMRRRVSPAGNAARRPQSDTILVEEYALVVSILEYDRTERRLALYRHFDAFD